MAGLSLTIEIDGNEAYKLIETAAKIIQNHKDDLTEQEKDEYKKSS